MEDDICRRGFALGSAAALGSLAYPAHALAEGRLKDIAAQSGIVFGSAIDYPDSHIFLNADVSKIYLEQCAVFATGYQLLWSQNQFSPNVAFDFAKADKVFDFATANGASVGAHPLIWHQFVPNWVQREVGKEGGRKIIETHVQTLIDRYRGRTNYWVVVNEPFDWNKRRSDGLIPCAYADAFGEEYIDISFAAAQDIDPNALLVLNEVGMEHDYPDAARKRQKVISTIKRLKNKNIQIDAIGIQAHLRPNFPFNRSKFRSFIRDIQRLGLEVIITEMDVEDGSLPGNIDRRDARVGKTMRDFVNTVVGTQACRIVVTWGLLNQHSWLNKPVANMGKWDLRNRRSDNLPHRPLLYDESLQPTAAWNAIAKALSGHNVPIR
ncbi:endo-1,4-beta-xylanase [Litoreibacter halocynthiae]|uniref:endo-1,4-beta-xylanase n=1 Tax=Litoreibacter halocynthiae TaxID=1242689 RepID=A0A4R7LFL3_9RHOB|nr:endo-1,4-beta-xylanase [Litoreibacter halocynthiae]TDT74134.1 endo-1,4-beta-xylanase [Litoreibacter halocynthiae]